MSTLNYAIMRTGDPFTGSIVVDEHCVVFVEYWKICGIERLDLFRVIPPRFIGFVLRNGLSFCFFLFQCFV